MAPAAAVAANAAPATAVAPADATSAVAAPAPRAPRRTDPVTEPRVVPKPPPKRGFDWLFVFVVALPTLVAALYYGLVASDVYLSESKFVVRSPERGSPSMLGSLLQGTGFTRSNDDTYTVHDFMMSRDALRVLDQSLGLRKTFSDPAIDRLRRFPLKPWDDSFEALYRHYTDHVEVAYDSVTAITTLVVRTHQPKQSQAMNAQLLAMSEALVNRLNDRSRQDMIASAEKEVRLAQERVRTTAQAFSAYRSDRSVFDPNSQSGLQLQIVSTLQEELRTVESQLAQLRRVAPDNPQIPALDQRADRLRRDIATESAKVIGGDKSLAGKAQGFDRLLLEKTFAEQSLGAAMAALESARAEAIRKNLYLERLVQPNLPDRAVEPTRIRNILMVLVVTLMLWGVLRLVVSSVREHAD